MFKDKVVVVTGGAMGIGETTCESFAKEGAKVVIADFNDLGKNVSERLNAQGFDTIFVNTDISKEDQVINLVQETIKKYGTLDIMCANAGIAPYKTPIDHTEEDFDKVIGTNLKGTFFCNKQAVIQMLKQENKGVIVNTGSLVSVAGRPNVLAYAASKGAVKMMTQTFALAYAESGIRVNCVCPSTIETPIMLQIVQDPEHLNRSRALHPMGRHGTPQEVADAILFLASDKSSFITGTVLMVDGGYTA